MPDMPPPGPGDQPEPDQPEPDQAAPDQAAPDQAAPDPPVAAPGSGAGEMFQPRPDRLIPVHVPRRVGVRRVPIIAGVLAVLIAGGLADRAGAHGRPPAPPGGGSPQPAAAPPQALSSSWFCAGATGNSGGSAPGRVVVTNAGSVPVHATVTLVPSQGRQAVQQMVVGARSQGALAEQVPGNAPWIGAIVDLDGGAVSVSQAVAGPNGQAAAPCATAGSQQWYFATGQTAINASTQLTLLNPYPRDAVVDLSFTTEQGVEQPPQFQGLVVPARHCGSAGCDGGLASIDLGTHLRRRAHIATSVTARTGRVVAWKTDVVSRPSPGESVIGTKIDPTSPTASDPAAPVAGVTVTLGSPAPSTRWLWPAGDAGNGVDEQYVIYNPGVRAAEVQLAINLDQGSAEPFRLTVGAEQVTTVVADGEARIPPGVGHSAVLRSTNGVPVVAERATAAMAPASQRGLGELAGSVLQASSWLLPTAAAPGSDGQVVLLNPTAAPVSAAIERLDGGSLPGVDRIRIPAGSRVVVSLGRVDPKLEGPVVVHASAPIVAESDQYATSGTGVSLSLGVPLAP